MVRTVFAGAILALAAISGDATACVVPGWRSAQEAIHSDIIVVGRLTNYNKSFDDTELSAWSAIFLANSTNGRLRAAIERGWLRQFGKFEFIVEEQLKGDVADRIEVAIADQRFGPPEAVPDGVYMLAVQATRLNSESPIGSNDFFSVVSPPCADPYLIRYPSAEADSIRRALAGFPPLPAEEHRPTVSELFEFQPALPPPFE